MSILENEILITLTPFTIKHYENLNYYIPRYDNKVTRGTKILVKVIDLPHGSSIRVTKICDECGRETKNAVFKDVIIGRENGDGKDYCRSCKNNMKQTIKNKDKKEKSLEYWAKENNKEYLLLEYSNNNKRPPSKISYGSHEKVIWKCSNCKSEYEMQVKCKTLQNIICPYCSGYRVNSTNSLAHTNKELTSQWHPTKNGDLTPYDVTSKSNKKVWWVGKCGHEWESNIANRSNGHGCPYCNGKKVDKKKSLFVINQELSKEWDYKRNEKTPHDYYPKSNKKVWWICSECGFSWNAIINDRSRGKGCPACCESKGEKRIRQWLNKNSIIFEAQIEYDGLIGTGGGNLSYDFYLPYYNLLIEYQGEFHDGSSGEYTKINLETQKEHDRRKREYAAKNNINLLEIWYWDFDNVEEILSKEITI